MVYSPITPPRQLASAPQPDTRFDLDMAYSDAWEVAVIDICVQDGRPWGDPQRFYSTLLLRPSEATNSPEVQSHMSCDSCAK